MLGHDNCDFFSSLKVFKIVKSYVCHESRREKEQRLQGQGSMGEGGVGGVAYGCGVRGAGRIAAFEASSSTDVDSGLRTSME